MKQAIMKRSSLILALVVLAAGSVFAQGQKPQNVIQINLFGIVLSGDMSADGKCIFCGSGPAHIFFTCLLLLQKTFMF